MRQLMCVIGVLMLSTTLSAQVYVRAGALVDVVGGLVLEDQVILIRDERIEQVGPASEVPVPDGASVIDLSSATVLPGLIDAHVHLTTDSQI